MCNPLSIWYVVHAALYALTSRQIDANAAESRARTVLLGLGFPLDKIDDSMSKLSGGWRTRCDLACALCQKVDILFLDEPTNFLDLPSVIWLQDYINGPALEDTTVVVVTHDRDFADAVAQELLILRHKKIERFKGNLSTYEREKIKKIRYLSTMSEAKDKQKAHIEQSIKNNINAAKRSGDDKKLKQAAMRQKKLDERWGMEVSAKGGRWKLNRDHAGYHGSLRAAIEIPDFDAIPRIKLPMLPPDLRFPGALVNLEKVSYGYSKKGPVVVNEVDLTIYQGNRIGLCGLNGSGKTTLVSLIDGTANATKGSITRHSRVQISRFSQLSVEELDAVCVATPNITALQHLIEFAGSKLEEKDGWAILGSLGLGTPAINSIPLMALSGGQKVRLALAKKVYTAPHLLILDEVTTHLDGETILALIFALREFEGALLVITHDRFFMRCVVEAENPAKISSRAALENMGDDEDSEDEEDETDPKKGIIYRMFKGGLKVLDGGMEQYEDICTRTAAKLTQKSKS
jgi:ATP-binding cassette subfamily F protein 3